MTFALNLIEKKRESVVSGEETGENRGEKCKNE